MKPAHYPPYALSVRLAGRPAAATELGPMLAGLARLLRPRGEASEPLAMVADDLASRDKACERALAVLDRLEPLIASGVSGESPSGEVELSFVGARGDVITSLSLSAELARRCGQLGLDVVIRRYTRRSEQRRHPPAAAGRAARDLLEADGVDAGPLIGVLRGWYSGELDQLRSRSIVRRVGLAKGKPGILTLTLDNDDGWENEIMRDASLVLRRWAWQPPLPADASFEGQVDMGYKLAEDERDAWIRFPAALANLAGECGFGLRGTFYLPVRWLDVARRRRQRQARAVARQGR